MRYAAKKRITSADAATRIVEVLRAHAGKTMTLEQLCHRTNLRIAQVGNGERYLKHFLAEHPGETQGWTLHIAMGPNSQHGLIQEGDVSLLDALARAKGLASRSENELAYREQQIKTVADPIARKKLARGIVYARAASESFADALALLEK